MKEQLNMRFYLFPSGNRVLHYAKHYVETEILDTHAQYVRMHVGMAKFR